MSGVTGIVEKPLEGAKTGQFGGFLGGLGKGLLGVVTKPTAGLVDFTSQSLEGIRKLVHLYTSKLFCQLKNSCQI